MKKILLISVACALLWDCTDVVETPESMRLDLTVTAIDTSIFSTTLFDTTTVPGARVFINSLSYGNSYSAETDSNGRAVFADILPDVYNISSTKRFTADEVILVTGAPTERVLNGQQQGLNIFGMAYGIDLYLTPVTLGTLVFSEIYYNGAKPGKIPYYFHDQFTEIYNNTDSTLYLDSLIIADAAYGYVSEAYIHSVHAYMFPGSGRDYPLGPGEMIIVAQDAINHYIPIVNPNSVDLSGADFEYYVGAKGDVNNSAVPDMIMLHHKYGNDFLYSVMNDAIVLLRVADPYAYGYDNSEQIMLPKSGILDAIEYRESLSEMDKKHLDATIDAGLTGGFSMYSSRSVERHIDHFKDGRAVLMDNNNSSIDFQLLDRPTPGYLAGLEQ
ncbi:MAG: DUF4876 domain-containing protein [Candidatus Neomarinimicrobiota bacterium]